MDQDTFEYLAQLLKQEKGLIAISTNIIKGGFGSVIFVEDKAKQKFAVKAQRINSEQHGQRDEKKLEFCKSESRVLKEVKHKNVVQYHSDYEIKFYHFLQMSFCECSLDGWIEQRGKQKLPKSIFLHFLHQILDGIEHVHSLNYVLRDLSNRNILTTTEGVIKLCDFGLAKQIDKQSVLLSQVQSQNQNGVYCYFPPELVRQTENNNSQQIFTQSKSGDIWAFGICLSFLGGITLNQALQFNQPNAVIKDAPLIDQFCNSIIKFILNPNPKERPTIPQIRKYIYDHLNSEKVSEQVQEQPNKQQISRSKVQDKLEWFYILRDLEIPTKKYKEIETECLRNQDKIESLLKLSQIYLNYTYEFEKAQHYALLSLEKDPRDPDVYLNQCDICLMSAFFMKKKCQDQIEYYIDRAFKLCPDYWRVYYMKSKYYYFQSQYDKAKEECQKAIELNGANLELTIRQLMCQIKKGDTENNKKVLKEIKSFNVKEEEEYLLFNQQLGFICSAAGEYDKAVEYYEKQIKLVPTPFSYNNLRLLYQNQLKDNKKAKDYYEKSLQLTPQIIVAFYNNRSIQNQ